MFRSLRTRLRERKEKRRLACRSKILSRPEVGYICGPYPSKGLKSTVSSNCNHAPSYPSPDRLVRLDESGHAPESTPRQESVVVFEESAELP